MRFISLLALALSLGVMPCMTRADNPMPPPPEGGLMVMAEGACRDVATQVERYCVVSQDRDGNVYVIMALDGEPVEIRQVVGNGYIVLWTQTPGELM